MQDTHISLGRAVVESLIVGGLPLTGACIVSSVAAGDFTEASDIDMLLIADDDHGLPGIFRRLIGDTVIEWMVLPRGYLSDVDAILADAGLCHDILTAILLLDQNGSLQQIQNAVALHYQKPQWVRRRAEGQLERADRAIRAMQGHLDSGMILQAQRAHVSALKGLFGVPRALANQRCTMARGLMFCREASDLLGWSGYAQTAVSSLICNEVSRDTVVDAQAQASRIIAASSLPAEQKPIRQWFLRSSDWLLVHGQPVDAVWPLYYWSSSTVEESGGQSNDDVWKPWMNLTTALELADAQGLARQCQFVKRTYEIAVSRIQSA